MLPDWYQAFTMDTSVSSFRFARTNNLFQHAARLSILERNYCLTIADLLWNMMIKMENVKTQSDGILFVIDHPLSPRPNLCFFDILIMVTAIVVKIVVCM